MKKKIINILVSVTKEHITLGTVSNCEECPVALAIRDRVCAGEVQVANHYIRVNSLLNDGSDRAAYIKTPTRVSRFISKFDGGKKVKPFKFILKAPVDVISGIKEYS